MKLPSTVALQIIAALVLAGTPAIMAAQRGAQSSANATTSPTPPADKQATPAQEPPADPHLLALMNLQNQIAALNADFRAEVSKRDAAAATRNPYVEGFTVLIIGVVAVWFLYVWRSVRRAEATQQAASDASIAFWKSLLMSDKPTADFVKKIDDISTRMEEFDKRVEKSLADLTTKLNQVAAKVP